MSSFRDAVAQAIGKTSVIYSVSTSPTPSMIYHSRTYSPIERRKTNGRPCTKILEKGGARRLSQ